MTLLFSHRKSVLFMFSCFFPLPRGWMNAFAGSARPKFIYIPLDAFIGSAVTGRWLCSLWIREVQMYEKRLKSAIRRKVAQSVAAAEISERLNAFSNIFSRRHRDRLLSPHPPPTPPPLSLCCLLPAFLHSPPHLTTPPAPLPSSAPKTSSSARAAVLLSSQRAAHQITSLPLSTFALILNSKSCFLRWKLLLICCLTLFFSKR